MERRTGKRGREGNWGAKRSAVRELTCSQALNSSAMASSLSVWGRWISLALLCTSLTDSPLLPAPPAFLQPLGVVAAGGCVVLRVDGGGYGEMDCHIAGMDELVNGGVTQSFYG